MLSDVKFINLLFHDYLSERGKRLLLKILQFIILALGCFLRGRFSFGLNFDKSLTEILKVEVSTAIVTLTLRVDDHPYKSSV